MSLVRFFVPQKLTPSMTCRYAPTPASQVRQGFALIGFANSFGALGFAQSLSAGKQPRRHGGFAPGRPTASVFDALSLVPRLRLATWLCFADCFATPTEATSLRSTDPSDLWRSLLRFGYSEELRSSPLSNLSRSQAQRDVFHSRASMLRIQWRSQSPSHHPLFCSSFLRTS